MALCLHFCALAGETDTVKQFSVLELYTSEGCSSCPPAERLMPLLAKKYGDKLYILEFHVDYWDRLGWKDKYSNNEYSNRQKSYTPIFNTNSVYTPQAIINGRTHLSGNSKDAIENILNVEAFARKSVPQIILTAQKTGASEVTVTFNTTLTDSELIYIALVQKEASTQVRAGENKGKLVRHSHIVRDFQMAMFEQGEKKLTIPDDITEYDCYVVAYIQDTTNMHIANAEKVKIR